MSIIQCRPQFFHAGRVAITDLSFAWALFRGTCAAISPYTARDPAKFELGFAEHTRRLSVVKQVL